MEVQLIQSISLSSEAKMVTALIKQALPSGDLYVTYTLLGSLVDGDYQCAVAGNATPDQTNDAVVADAAQIAGVPASDVRLFGGAR